MPNLYIRRKQHTYGEDKAMRKGIVLRLSSDKHTPTFSHLAHLERGNGCARRAINSNRLCFEPSDNY